MNHIGERRGVRRRRCRKMKGRKPEPKHWFQSIGIVFLVPIILLYQRIGYYLGENSQHFTTDIWEAWEDVRNNFRWLLGKERVDNSIARRQRERYLTHLPNFKKYTTLSKEEAKEVIDMLEYKDIDLIGENISRYNHPYITCEWSDMYDSIQSLGFYKDLCWVNDKDENSLPIKQWKELYEKAEAKGW